ncbi:MAG: Asp-tRNA(Asn)/Glu-tRNA(Gln) amidotransferase subunit GatA [Alphaproteobacteria bacterium]
MSDLLNLSLTDVVSKLKNKEVSSAELTEASIQAIETSDNGAFITETPELAMQMAKAADVRLAKDDIGLIEGVPIGVKDLFNTKDVRTTCGSSILGNFVPPYESTVTQNLRDQGGVFLGKLNMDEFAMGSANLNPTFGPVKNPWIGKDGKSLVPGGSSGGSAASVASNQVFGATGTDTGGSIRQPAAFCGITGLKPTYGRCSRFGIIAFASSLDQAGPMARTVADNALLLQAMASYDPKDSTSVDEPVPDYSSQLGYSIKGKKIGIPAEYVADGMSEEIHALWQQGRVWLESAGAEIVEISLPHTKYALPCYYIIAPAEASSNLSRYDGVRYGVRVDPAADSDDKLHDMYRASRAAGFGDEVQRRIMIGAYVLSAGFYDAYYNQARKVRTLIARDFENVFAAGVDAILTPTTPSAAFAIGEQPSDPVQMYLNDVFTVPTSMAGLPGISIPSGLSADGKPLGLQLIGKPFQEGNLMNIAQKVEEAAAFPYLGV